MMPTAIFERARRQIRARDAPTAKNNPKTCPYAAEENSAYKDT